MALVREKLGNWKRYNGVWGTDRNTCNCQTTANMLCTVRVAGTRSALPRHGFLLMVPCHTQEGTHTHALLAEDGGSISDSR